MSIKVANLQQSILKALYAHVVGDVPHPSGRDFLQPGEIAELLPFSASSELLERTLRIMHDGGQLEMFRNVLVYRLTNSGLLEAESQFSGSSIAHVLSSSKRRVLAAIEDLRRQHVIDWGKWGAIAGILAIPISFVLWYFS